MAELKTQPFLKDIQEYIQKGAEELGFDKLDALQRCLMLGEEVGELFKSIRKYEKITVDKSSKVSSIQNELADVLLQTCAVANYFKIDLEKAFTEKQKKDTGRWK